MVMTNRRIFFAVSGICAILILLVLGNMFFSVRKIIPSSVVVSTNNSRIVELDKAIPESNSIKIGQSMFTIDTEAVARQLENEFFDIKIVSIEKSFPNIVYIDYQLLEKQLEVYNGSKYFQLSSTGRVLGVSEQSVASDFAQQLVKLSYDKLDSDVKVGFNIVDERFDLVSTFVEYFIEAGRSGFLTSSVANINLNTLDDSDNAKFVLTLNSSVAGYFEIYLQNDMVTAAQLVLDNVSEAFSGKNISIRNGKATVL